MITLTVYDGESVFTIQYFNTIAEKNDWISQQQGKFFWKESFTFQVVDNTPTQEQVDEDAAAAETARNNLIAHRNSAITKLQNAIPNLNDNEIAALFGTTIQS